MTHKNKVFTAAALDQVKRLARQSKTIYGMTFEQVAEQVERDGMAWLQVFQALHFLQSNPLVTVSPSALDFVRIVAELARNGHMTDGVEQALVPLDTLLPMGRFAAPFKEHADRERRPGPVRAWIKKYMAKHRDHKPAQAWEAFKKRPPKECKVCENRQGKYIETKSKTKSAPDYTGRAYFGTMVGQERPKK
jgi:hypothetical protein